MFLSYSASMRQSIWKPNYIILRNELKKLRKNKGYSQRKLASLIGKPHTYISKYESGERNLDYFEVLEICQHCDTDPVNFTRQIMTIVDLDRNQTK